MASRKRRASARKAAGGGNGAGDGNGGELRSAERERSLASRIRGGERGGERLLREAIAELDDRVRHLEDVAGVTPDDDEGGENSP